MPDFRFGPVELYLVGFTGDRPDPGVIRSLVELVESGLVRLVDFVIVSKSLSGDITITEVADEAEEMGFAGVELIATGLTGEEDIDDLAPLIPPGGSAALVALELTYARTLAEKLAASGGFVLRTERIPAAVVNAALDAADENPEEENSAEEKKE